MTRRVEIVPPDGLPARPHDATTEAETLGAVLLFEKFEDPVFDALTADDFYTDRARLLFGAMQTVRGRGQRIDIKAAQSALGQAAALDLAGFIGRAMDGIPAGVNIESMIERLRELRTKRQIMGGLEAAANDVLLGTAPPADVIGTVQASFEAIAQDKPGDDLTPACELASALLSDYDKALVPGLSTGLADVDAVLGARGLEPGELVIVGARTSVGKSVMAVQVAIQTAMQLRRPVAFFSMELSRKQVMQRAVCAWGRFNSTFVRERILPGAERQKYFRALEQVGDGLLFVDDQPCDVARIRRLSKRLKAQAGDIGLVCVDYLQRVKTGRGRRYEEQRYREIAAITSALKDLAMELGCPVILPCQLGREVAKQGRRPRLEDLRESGDIENDADTVLLLHRHVEQPAGVGTGSDADDVLPPGCARVYIAKRREGDPGRASGYLVKFNGEYGRFDNLTSEREAAA